MNWAHACMALVACLVIAGCGDDDASAADAAIVTTDISGWFDTVIHRQGDCGNISDSGNAPAFLWVEGLGSSTFYVRYCSATAEADCFATPFYDFTDPIAEGWAAEGGSAFFSVECTLSWERTAATVIGGELRVHTLRYSQTSAIPQVDCTLDAAAALTDPCTFEIELTANRM